MTILSSVGTNLSSVESNFISVETNPLVHEIQDQLKASDPENLTTMILSNVGRRGKLSGGREAMSILELIGIRLIKRVNDLLSDEEEQRFEDVLELRTNRKLLVFRCKDEMTVLHKYPLQEQPQQSQQKRKPSPFLMTKQLSTKSMSLDSIARADAALNKWNEKERGGTPKSPIGVKNHVPNEVVFNEEQMAKLIGSGTKTASDSTMSEWLSSHEETKYDAAEVPHEVVLRLDAESPHQRYMPCKIMLRLEAPPSANRRVTSSKCSRDTMKSLKRAEAVLNEWKRVSERLEATIQALKI